MLFGRSAASGITAKYGGGICLETGSLRTLKWSDRSAYIISADHERDTAKTLGMECMRVALILFCLALSSAPSWASSAFACYGKGAVGLTQDADGHQIAVRFKPQSSFSVRISSEEIWGDRFPNPLACAPIPDTDQISCTGDGLMLNYDQSDQKYVLTFIKRGTATAVLEAGTCSWLTND